MKLAFIAVLLFSFSSWAQMPPLSDLWFHQNVGQPVQYDLNAYLSEKVNGKVGFDSGISKALNLPSEHLSEVIIAVMDTGADISHPLIKNSLALNIGECQNGTPRLTANDDRDQNGFKGDCIGLDFTKENSDKGFHRVSDSHGHGTHVAGIIASFTQYSEESIFKKIKILPLKVVGSGAVGLQTRIVNALDYAYRRGTKVVNFSMGWPLAGESTVLKKAIELAQSRGMIIVAAAGNNSHDSALYPCNYKGVICVGSLQNDGMASRFSNYGAHVDFSAPGSQILSSVPYTVNQQFSNLKGFDKKSGTSQASPIIATYVAALLSHNSKLSRDEVYQRLASSAAGSNPGPGLNAFPQLKHLFHAEVKNIILPEMKERVTLLTDGDLINFPIDLFNPGAITNSAKLEVRLLTKGYQLLDNSSQVSFAFGETRKQVVLRIKPMNLMVESFLKVEVTITTQATSKSFVLNTQLMRAGALGNIKGSLSFNELGKLYSLNSQQSSSKQSYFLAVKQNLITLFTLKDSNLEKLGSTLIPAGESLLLASSQVLDLNFDGQDDLLLLTQKDDENLGAYYLNDQLNPLIPEVLSFNYKAEAAVFSGNTTLHFIPQTFAGKKIKFPLFIENGVTSRADFNPNHWDFKKNQSERNLYWLEPKMQDGNAELLTRTLTNDNFRKSVLSQLALAAAHKLELMTLINDPNMIRVLGVVKDSDGQPLVGLSLEMKDQNAVPNITLIESQTKTIDKTGLIFPVENIQPGSKKLLYISSPKPNEITLYQINEGESMSHLTKVKAGLSDEFLDVTSATSGKDGMIVYLQTKNTIVMVSETGKPKSRAIIRHSFLDGTLASEFYKSITVRTESTKPALYVDQSFVNGNGVYTLVEQEGELISPLEWSLAIPKGCSTMDPIQNHKLKIFEVLVQCRNQSGEITLMTYPLKIAH